jgi:hypothetical protein
MSYNAKIKIFAAKIENFVFVYSSKIECTKYKMFWLKATRI